MKPRHILAFSAALTLALAAPELRDVTEVPSESASSLVGSPSDRPIGHSSSSAPVASSRLQDTPQPTSPKFSLFSWLWPSRDRATSTSHIVTNSSTLEQTRDHQQASIKSALLPTATTSPSTDQGPANTPTDTLPRLEVATKPDVTVTVTVTTSKRSDSGATPGWAAWWPWDMPPHEHMVETTTIVTPITAINVQSRRRARRGGRDAASVAAVADISTVAETTAGDGGSATSSLPTLSNPLLSLQSSASTGLPLPPLDPTPGSGSASHVASGSRGSAPGPLTTSVSSVGGLPPPIPWDSAISDTLTMASHDACLLFSSEHNLADATSSIFLPTAPPCSRARKPRSTGLKAPKRAQQTVKQAPRCF